MTFVVIHADDLGLSRGFNQGILESASRGVLTSTSIRVNGSAYREALEEIRPAMPHVGIGLHLNIVEGQTRMKRSVANSLLCDSEGRFKIGFGDILRNRRNPKFLAEVEAEYRNQIEIAFGDLDNLDHLNSHMHSHGVPEIFEITCKLAAEYKIPFVRLSRERFYAAPPWSQHLHSWYPLNLVKFAVLNAFARRNARAAAKYGVRTNDLFVGILYTGRMHLATIVHGLEIASASAEIVEVLLHPVSILGDRNETFLNAPVRNYVIDPARALEVSTLISPNLLNALRDKGYHLANYRTLADSTAISFGTAVLENAAAAQAVHQRRRAPRPPLKTYFVLDETTFYQPEFFRRLVTQCEDIEPCGLAIVVLPKGGKLQKYLLKRWRDLGVRDLVGLSAKRLLLTARGQLPSIVRGDFEASVQAVAKRHNIPFRIISKINTPEFFQHLRELEPDVLISSNSLVFNEELVRIPKLACINRHSSLLPSYGGILPAFRAVQHGESFAGASIHLMTSGIDEGDVLSRKWLPVFPGDTLDHLYRLCFVLSYEGMVEVLAGLRWGPPPRPLETDGLKPSYFSYPGDQDWREFRARGGRFI